MKEPIQAFDYAGYIAKQLQDGQVLLSTRAEKFNSMVIGWGTFGINWGKPVFAVYVREGRFTREQLDKNPEFTVNVRDYEDYLFSRRMLLGYAEVL